MAIRVLRYVTVDVDDRLRRRVRRVGDRFRLNVRSYLLSAADDIDAAGAAAGSKARGLCDAAVQRVDTVVTRVSDRIDPLPPEPEEPQVGRVRLEAV